MTDVTGTPENRDETGRFQKGQSGNPGGRPKAESEVRELAQQHGPAAVNRLVALMNSRNERVAVAACQAVLDRGYGKAPQAMKVDGDLGIHGSGLIDILASLDRDEPAPET